MEIKNRFTGEVILVIETLVGADLREANLREADLYGADLREANLYGADLREADLYGADLYGRQLIKNPIFLAGLRWHVVITDFHMKIGCQLHPIENWEGFSNEKISGMSSGALEFWNIHKQALLSLCETQKV